MLSAICDYCGGKGVATYAGMSHKVDPSFGPFSLFTCESCGSLGTINRPSTERLERFYREYHLLRPHWYIAAAEDGSLHTQYRWYAGFLEPFVRRGKSWIDVGAGHGEISNLLAARHPGTFGWALDVGERSNRLRSEVRYVAVDLNKDGWAGSIERKFDLVFSVAVWEHVLHPAEFAAQALSLIAPGGRMVLITPNFGSIARRVLDRKWPYFEPGEHISIPTVRGARACIEQVASRVGLPSDGYNLNVQPVAVGYSLRYLLHVLGASKAATLLPPTLAAPLPTGLLCAVLNLRDTPSRSA